MAYINYVGAKKRFHLHPMTLLKHLILIALFFATLYPFWYVLVIALSEGETATGYQLIFWPDGFTFGNISYVVSTPDFLRIYGNTAFVVVMGTFCSLITTMLLAYGLSQRVYGIRAVRILVIFTMLFGGGMIPMYLVVRATGLLNSLWALILPGMVSPFYTFIMLNALRTIPDSLSESAQIDGAGPVTILFKIMLPLSLPTLATLTLFYAVNYWNTYFSAVLYTPRRSQWTLQIFLRQILLLTGETSDVGGATDTSMVQYSTNIKMATVLVAVVPVMMIYPFLQKHFTKGIMVGAVKQ